MFGKNGNLELLLINKTIGNRLIKKRIPGIQSRRDDTSMDTRLNAIQNA